MSAPPTRHIAEEVVHQALEASWTSLEGGGGLTLQTHTVSNGAASQTSDGL